MDHDPEVLESAWPGMHFGMKSLTTYFSEVENYSAIFMVSF